MVQGQQQESWDGKRPQPCATTPHLQSREVACAHSALPAEKVPLTIGSAAGSGDASMQLGGSFYVT